jgi:hypothetical protein
VYALARFASCIAESPNSSIHVHTDNKSFLDALLRKQHMSTPTAWDRWHRWILALARFPQVVLRRIGTAENRIADCLSRLPGATVGGHDCPCSACVTPLATTGPAGASWLCGEAP